MSGFDNIHCKNEAFFDDMLSMNKIKYFEESNSENETDKILCKTDIKELYDLYNIFSANKIRLNAGNLMTILNTHYDYEPLTLEEFTKQYIDYMKSFDIPRAGMLCLTFPFWISEKYPTVPEEVINKLDFHDRGLFCSECDWRPHMIQYGIYGVGFACLCNYMGDRANETLINMLNNSDDADEDHLHAILGEVYFRNPGIVVLHYRNLLRSCCEEINFNGIRDIKTIKELNKFLSNIN